MNFIQKLYYIGICTMLFTNISCGNDELVLIPSDSTITSPTDTTSQDTTGDDTNDGSTNDNDTNNPDSFVFAPNLVMEHSWNTGGCTPGPCDTIDESLSDVFQDGKPNDLWFFETNDRTELNLKCQLDKGRRTEFKQVSEGALSSPSRMEFDAVYFDVPEEGMTIAQVHNRGGNSNKPFFRLELHEDELETVVRKDPEVASSDTTFDKEFYSFINGDDYNEDSLHIVIEKGEGVVHLLVEQDGVVLIDETYTPQNNTNWVQDNGIANGFYLKAGVYNPAEAHTEEIDMQYTSFVFESEDN